MDFQSLSTFYFGRGNIGVRLRLESFFAGLLFAFLTIVIHGGNLFGSWRWDDGVHMAYANAFSPLQYFFEPEITRLQSGANVSPWNAFFYDINLNLFGMHPAGHYGHMLLVLWLAACLFYLLLRNWLSPLSAFIGVAVFLLGKPTLHIAAGLMHGHYATGLLFSFLTLLGWVNHVQRGGHLWLPFSVFAYLLAVACKEIYVPLVIILPFIPVASWRQRLRFWAPYISITVFYVAWRYMVLGRFLGGYERNKFSYEAAVEQFLNIPYFLFGAIPGFLFFIPFFFFFSMAARRRKIDWLLCFVGAVITLLPLIPLTSFPGIHQADRYLFGPWIAFSALVATLVPRGMRSGNGETIAICILVCSMLASHWQGRKELDGQITYWDRLYDATLSLDTERQALFIGDDDGYKRMVLGEARRLSDLLTNRQNTPQLLIIDKNAQFLHHAIVNAMEIVEFREDGVRPMEEVRIKEVFPYFFQNEDFNLADEKFLGIDMVLRDGIIRWRFTPENFEYYVSIRDLGALKGFTEIIKIPDKGQASWSYGKIQMSFCHVVDRSVKQYCSPMLDFDFEKNKNQSWSGMGRLAP